MFRLQKSNGVSAQADPVSPALQMALTIRLRIFAAEAIVPAAAAFLEAYGERLDQVRAHRHAVDFEAAKARSWWMGTRTDELVARGREIITADPEIGRLKASEDLETILFDAHLEQQIRALIHDRDDDLELGIRSMSENRLNVQ